MAYNISLTNGSTFKTVADGTINSDSAMVMIGKDFSGYGQYIDQNIIRLLESGNLATLPVNPSILQGQLWFDATNKSLKVAYISNTGAMRWTSASAARTGANTPSQVNASLGDLWYAEASNGNPAFNELKIYSGSNNWTSIGPYNATSNITVGTLNVPTLLNVTGTTQLGIVQSNAVNTDTITATNVNATVGNVTVISGFRDINGITGNINVTGTGNLANTGVFSKNISASFITAEKDSSVDGNIVSQKFLSRDRSGGSGAGFYGNVYGINVLGSNIGNTDGSSLVFGNVSAVQSLITSIGNATNQLASPLYSTSTVTVAGNTNVGYYGPTTSVVANTIYGNLVGTVTLPTGGTVSASNVKADTILLPANGTDANARIKLYGSNGSAFFNQISANSITVPDGNLEVTGAAQILGNLTVSGNFTVTGNTTFVDASTTITNSPQQILANNANNITDFAFGNVGILWGNVANGVTNSTFPSGNLIGLTWNSGTSYMRFDKAFAVIPTANSTAGYALTINGNIGPTTGSTGITLVGNVNNPAGASVMGNLTVGNIFNVGGSVFDNPLYVSYVRANVARTMLVDDPSGANVAYAFPQYAASPTTIVVRDSTGKMNGTATTALYADLAERYLLDAEYPAGTLVEVGGTAEATAATENGIAFGIVSTQPGFLMNEGLAGGTYIALKGRVPTRVVGTISKGDKIGPSVIPGVGTTNTQNYIAIALESYDSSTEGTIEAIVL